MEFYRKIIIDVTYWAFQHLRVGSSFIVNIFFVAQDRLWVYCSKQLHCEHFHMMKNGWQREVDMFWKSKIIAQDAFNPFNSEAFLLNQESHFA